jgi:phosphohistidine phosphatase SixA
VVTIDDRLYYGGVGDLIAALEERGDEGIVAFGHEPTWSAAVNGLIGGGDVRMVTAAAACLDIPSGMRPGTASLRWLITPAALGGGKA